MRDFLKNSSHCKMGHFSHFVWYLWNTWWHVCEKFTGTRDVSLEENVPIKFWKSDSGSLDFRSRLWVWTRSTLVLVCALQVLLFWMITVQVLTGYSLLTNCEGFKNIVRSSCSIVHWNMVARRRNCFGAKHSMRLSSWWNTTARYFVILC